MSTNPAEQHHGIGRREFLRLSAAAAGGGAAVYAAKDLLIPKIPPLRVNVSIGESSDQTGEIEQAPKSPQVVIKPTEAPTTASVPQETVIPVETQSVEIQPTATPKLPTISNKDFRVIKPAEPSPIREAPKPTESINPDELKPYDIPKLSLRMKYPAGKFINPDEMPENIDPNLAWMVDDMPNRVQFVYTQNRTSFPARLVVGYKKLDIVPELEGKEHDLLRADAQSNAVALNKYFTSLTAGKNLQFRPPEYIPPMIVPGPVAVGGDFDSLLIMAKFPKIPDTIPTAISLYKIKLEPIPLKANPVWREYGFAIMADESEIPELSKILSQQILPAVKFPEYDTKIGKSKLENMK